MDWKRRLYGWAALVSLCLVPAIARGQDGDARRLGSIVSVAIAEYGLAVNERGAVISAEEYAETTDFLADARAIAGRLTSRNAAATRAELDAIIAAVAQKRPPSELSAHRERFAATLGSAGAMEMPTGPLDTAAGRQLFVGSCASCHGVRGLGDGPLARGLSTVVPAIGSAAATPRITPTLAYEVSSVGIRGTSMPAFAGTMSAQQRWNVVNYMYALRGQQMQLPATPADGHPSATSTAASVLLLLDSAQAFARARDTRAAGDRAFDAYLAFEPLEALTRAKNPGLVASLERSFAEFKVAVRGGDTHGASIAREAIASELPRVVAIVNGTGETAWAAFWQSFLIILREGFEAILVVGAVVAFLIKTGHRDRLRSIWIGVALGVVASLLTAILIKTLFSAIPASSEIVEAVSLLIAVVVLFSVSYWLISKVEAVQWQKFIRDKVTTALKQGGGGALMLVAFLAVYREGAETALFYQALFSQSSGSALPLILGIAVGFVALALIFVLFYRFGIRIPMRPFFAVTSLLLYYMAFVFAGRGIRELQEGNVLSMTRLQHVPTVAWLGLFPTVETVAIQAVLLALFAFGLVRTFLIRPSAGASASP